MKKSLFILLVVALVGCTKPPMPDGMPKLVSVTLTFTQEGVPLSGAMVLLQDTSGSVPFVVGGTTDDKGTLVVHTYGQYKGAPLGKFKVCVTKKETTSGPPVPPDMPSNPLAAVGDPRFEAYFKELEKNPPRTYSLVEKQYASEDTTPLEIEITGPMTKTLDVGKAVRDAL